MTVSLGIKEPQKLQTTLSTIMNHIINEHEFDPTDGILHHTEGVDLLPSNGSLTSIELARAPLIGRETVLQRYIEKVEPLYDSILIDTPPTFDLLTINALAAAKEGRNHCKNSIEEKTVALSVKAVKF